MGVGGGVQPPGERHGYGPGEVKDPDPRQVGSTPDRSESKWRQAALGLTLVCLLPVLALLVAGGGYRLALWLF